MKTVSALALISIWGIFGISRGLAQMTVVNGASFDPSQPVAPGSFATVFGQNLCSQTMAGDLIAPFHDSEWGACYDAVRLAGAD